MSGGLPFPASRSKSLPSSTVFLILAAAALLSGCGLLPVQNPPAPISEALVEPVEETAGEPLTMPPVPAPTHPEEPEAPKKPHREVPRPKPVQRPESPTPPPPPPPPIVA
ncbi:PRC-barrel domain containing protein, partial [Burkholderia contaminans]